MDAFEPLTVDSLISEDSPTAVGNLLETTESGGDSSMYKEKTPAGSSSQKTCRVCGDTALNMNFGAVSCESCKAFFRRNALKKKEFRCPFKGTCQIDVETRRWCQQCRLKKCFEAGMKKELIQKGKRGLTDLILNDNLKNNSKNNLKSNLNNSDNLNNNLSNLNNLNNLNNSANLNNNLNNLINADDVTLLPVKRVKRAPCSPTPSGDSISSTESSSEGVASLGAGLEMLEPFERERILELVRANEVMMESNPDEEMAAVRYQEMHRLVDVINMTDIAIRRVIKMAKRITGFKNLIQEDQIALLKGACFEMMILRAVSHYNIEKDCWQGPQATMIKVDILKEAKGNCYEEIRTFIHSFAPELRKDNPLLLILGAIALFHPERPSLELRGQIRAQKSLYLFLLHSYIRVKYGKNNLRETEKFYVELTNKLDFLHVLNDRHISMFMDVNPKDVEPLLIEIFDLNMTIPVKL